MLLGIGVAAAAAAGVLAGCSSGNGTPAAASGTGGTQTGTTGMTVATRTVSGVGTVLTDQSGKTLYTPQQEANGAIKCTSSCLSFWFPVTMGSGTTPHAAGNLSGALGEIQRPDGGGRQLTYNGEPLYTFRLDSVPGQVHGNDFMDSFGGQSFTWHAATVGAAKVAPSQPANNPPGNSQYPGGSAGY
jgi:predicted lipoprotein with Yx(FWY)xxD motif